MEYHTRWTIAQPTPEITGDAVVNFLYRHIITEFGAPVEIITDNGKQFIEGAMQKYENILKTRHKATTPYHPQTNGMVERMHRDMNHSLRTLTLENPSRWDEFLPQVVFAMRSKKHATTGYSPFYLMHGVEPRQPIDPRPPASFMKPLTNSEILEIRTLETTDILEKLGFARQEAYERSVALASKMAQRKQVGRRRKASRIPGPADPAVTTHTFQVGDLVLRRNHVANKLDPRWSGPYLVVKLGYPGSYWIQEIGSETMHPQTVSDAHLAFWKVARLAVTREGENDVNRVVNKVQVSPEIATDFLTLGLDAQYPLGMLDRQHSSNRSKREMRDRQHSSNRAASLKSQSNA